MDILGQYRRFAAHHKHCPLDGRASWAEIILRLPAVDLCGRQLPQSAGAATEKGDWLDILV